MTRIIFTLFLTLSLFGCGQEAPPLPVNCAPHEARIQVADTYLLPLCGCGSSNGQIYTRGGLTCDIAIGNTLVFFFQSQGLAHQILSTGASTFASSYILSSGYTELHRSYTVVFSKAGIYTFSDAFNANLAGQINVH